MSAIYCKLTSCPYNKGLYCDKLTMFVTEQGVCAELTLRSPQEYVKQEVQNGFRSEFSENKREDCGNEETLNGSNDQESGETK